MAQLKSTNIIGNLSVTGSSKATDFKGVSAELSGTVSIGGETNIDNVLSAKKLLIKNDNGVTIGHTYTGTNYLELVLGNSTATSATNGTQGYLYLYGTGTNWTKFISGNPTANNTLTLPTASGTIALTSNIPGAEKGITLANGKYGHSNTAITAGSVGSAQSPSHGGTFAIPKITYDAYGHITGATTVNITLPGDNNTDTKVTQAAAITKAGNYPLILGYSTATTEVTNSVNKAAALTYNPSTKILAVDGGAFNGSHNGKILGVTETNPDSATYYAPLFINTGDSVSSTTTEYVRRTNQAFNIRILEGTASKTGYVYLDLGNLTASGTAGNKYGAIKLFSEKTGAVTLKSNASSTSDVTATFPAYSGNVTISMTSEQEATESSATYNIPFYVNAGNRIGYNEGFRYNTLEGTTDTLGNSSLYLGNSTASGAAGNKYGSILIYGTNANYTYLRARVAPTYNKSKFYLPAGDAASDDCYAIWSPNESTAVGSTSQPVYITANGKAAVITTLSADNGGTGTDDHIANRLVHSNNNGTIIRAADHYADSSHIGVCYTKDTAPSYNLYVNGTVGTSKAITLTGTGAETANIHFVRSNNPAYITSAQKLVFIADKTSSDSLGTANACLTITKNAIYSNTDTSDSQDVTLGTSSYRWDTIYGKALNMSGASTLSGNVSIGGTLSVTKAATLSSTLTVTGATTLNGTLTANNTSTFTKDVSITSTTASTSMTTGALKVSGGVGVAGQLNAKTVRVDNSVYFQYNSTNECLDVIFG